MLFFFEHVTPVYIYSILYVVSLFCCHACIMQRGLDIRWIFMPLCPVLSSPRPLAPLSRDSSVFPATRALTSARQSPFFLSAPGFAISWWATADTPLRGDYSVCLCSTNHPVSSPRTWFQNMRKLGESSWLIRFTNHSFISLQVGVSVFLRTKRLYFFESFFFFFSKSAQLFKSRVIS